MSLQIIKAFPEAKLSVNTYKHLQVSEFFCDTIQGEGVYAGHPAAFLRLQGCTLKCSWCDTKEVWRKGNPYTFEKLFVLMEHPAYDLIRKLKEGQHLVLTGGSPLLQQERLLAFFRQFEIKYRFKPFIEIENECSIVPLKGLIPYIDCWNNSPKLPTSGNKKYAINIDMICALSKLENSYFKFVITGRKDWTTVKNDYLRLGIVRKNQVILMPEGQTRYEIEQNRNLVLSLAVENNVRYSPRMQVELWDKVTGV